MRREASTVALFTSPFRSPPFHFHRLIIIFMALGRLHHSSPSFVLIHLIIPPDSLSFTHSLHAISLQFGISKELSAVLFCYEAMMKNWARRGKEKLQKTFFIARLQTSPSLSRRERHNNAAASGREIWISNELFSILDDMFFPFYLKVPSLRFLLRQQFSFDELSGCYFSCLGRQLASMEGVEGCKVIGRLGVSR